MLPQSIRDTYLDLEPETLRRYDEQAEPAPNYAFHDEEPSSSTRVMNIKHGAKSSTHAVVKARIVPSPFPSRPSSAPPAIAHAMRPQLYSEPTWLRPSQNLAMLPPPPAKQFEDFDFAQFEEEEAPSDQMPVVHGHVIAHPLQRPRTLAERLANPMSQEDAQLCWEHAQALAAEQALEAERESWAPNYMQIGDVRPNYQPHESGIRPATVIRGANASHRVSYARALTGFALALVLGAMAMASYRGDITEKSVRHVGVRAQIAAQNLAARWR